MDYREIAKEINRRTKIDQDARNKVFAEGYSPTDKDWDKLEKIDKDNSEYIKSILNKHGFISIAKFGKKASFNAWLIIQHADHDIPLMKKYLKLMEENEGDYEKKNYAYLRDRLLCLDGKKQIYGTQVQQNEMTGEWEPLPLRKPEMVDKLRKKVGLESLEIYLKSF